MIAVSARYALAAIALLIIAAIPVAYHQRAGSLRDDCANPAELFPAQRIAGVTASRERFGRHRDGFFQWTEGQFRRWRFSLPNPEFRVIRAHSFGEFFFEPKRFFIGNPVARNDTEIRHLEVDGERHPYFTRTDRRELDLNVASYMYVHRGEPVTNVFASLWDSVVVQLVDGTYPVTLLMIDGQGEAGDEQALLDWSERSMGTLWNFYRSACEAGPAA